jgi:hypothetical protein
MQVLQVHKTPRGVRKSGRWSRAPRLGTRGPGLAAAIAGIIGLAALTATLLATRTGTIQTVTIPAAASFVAALEEQLSTGESRVGQPVTLYTREPLRISEEFTLPAGIVIRGQVLRTTSESTGGPELAIGFTDLEIAGETYAVAAEPFRVGKAELTPSAKGGGSGKAGQEGAGETAGIITGDQIVLPAGQRIRIRLSESISVRFNGSRTTQGS